MKKTITILLMLSTLIFAGCSIKNKNINSSSSNNKFKIEVAKNNSSEVAKILTEESSSTNEYTNRVYRQENLVSINDSTSINNLLTIYSWDNGSYILNFDQNNSITAYLFQGSKRQLYSRNYGTYKIINEDEIEINISTSYKNAISSYTYQVIKYQNYLLLTDINTATTKINLYALNRIEK